MGEMKAYEPIPHWTEVIHPSIAPKSWAGDRKMWLVMDDCQVSAVWVCKESKNVAVVAHACTRSHKTRQVLSAFLFPTKKWAEDVAQGKAAWPRPDAIDWRVNGGTTRWFDWPGNENLPSGKTCQKQKVL